MVREFVEKEITPYAAEMDAENHMRDGLIDKANEMGLLNVIVPEELDGPGLDSISVATIYEELGKGCAGVATSLAANSLATVPVLLAGTDEQKKMYCDILNNGGLADMLYMGVKLGIYPPLIFLGIGTMTDFAPLITNGGLAEIFLVFANTRKTGGIRGLTAFIVPKDTPGFSVGKKENKMGIRPSNTTELVLQDVVIPESYRVGREGEGFRIAMNTLDSARPFVGAVSVGIAQAALDCAVKYAKERRQFGQPIASFQMVQGMLADMAMKVETARLMVQKACWMRDQGMEFSKEAAMAKCYAADVAMQVTTDAVQVMGGYGYTKEYPVEKMMRDAKIMQIYEGTNQIQRLVIANKLLY